MGVREKMRIGIVLHPYGEDKPAGLGRAIFEITRSILNLETKFPSGRLVSKNEYLIILRKRPKTLPEFPGNNWKIKIADYKYFWLDRAISGENLDVCIFNTPIISFFKRPKKTIVVAYDFAYEDYGKNSFLKFYNKYSLKKADVIVSISEATKKEIVRLFSISEEKIKVVYLGFNNICEIPPAPLQRIPEKYFLFIGAIKERKNVLGIVRAFHEAKKGGKLEYKLLIAGNGKGKYYEDVLNYVKNNRLANEVIFLGHITDANLSYLYKNASALLYPSFIEGFGFPVLEAMACGLPVITSTTSSLPEVAGEAAILADPASIEEIKRAIINISSNAALKKEMIKKGKEQIKKFSWKKTGEGILDLLG